MSGRNWSRVASTLAAFGALAFLLSPPIVAADRIGARAVSILPTIHIDPREIASRLSDYATGKPLVDGVAWCRARVPQALRQGAARARVAALGGYIGFDWSAVPSQYMAWEGDGPYSYFYKEPPFRRLLWHRNDAHPPAPKWLTDVVGPDLFSEIETVNLMNRKVTDTDCELFESLPTLSYIDLDDTQVGDAGLAHLIQMPRLSFLSLDKTKITDSGLKHLQRTPSLQSLWLNDTEVSDKGIANLEGLNLQEIHLDNTPVGDDAMAQIAKFKHLRALHLSGTQVTNHSAESLRQLADLEVLDLGDTQVGDIVLDKIKSLQKLEYLRLSNTRITDEGLKSIAHLTNLRHLDLTNDAIHVPAMAGLAPLNHLELLLIHNHKFTPEEARTLFEATLVNGRTAKMIPALAAATRANIYGIEFADRTILSWAELAPRSSELTAALVGWGLESDPFDNTDVPVSLIKALGRVTAPADRLAVARRLVHFLSDSRTEVRKAAIEVVVDFGGKSREVLTAVVREGLGSEWVQIGSGTETALARIPRAAGADPDQYLPPLIDALHDANPRLRRRAATVLSSWGPAASNAKAALENAAKSDRDASVRTAAEAALKQIGSQKSDDERDIELVIHGNPPASIRADSPAAKMWALLQKYENGEDKISGNDLAKLPDADLLFLNLLDRHGSPYSDAEARLGGLNTDRTFATLAGRLKSGTPHDRLEALSHLSKFDRPETIALLSGLLKNDAENTFRREAAEHLGHLKGPRVVEALLNATDDRDLLVAAAAVRNLSSIAPDKAFQPALRLLDKPLDGGLREWVIDAVGKCHCKAGVKALLDEYKRETKDAANSSKAVNHHLDYVLGSYAAITAKQLGPKPDNWQQWREWWADAEPLLTDDLRLVDASDSKKTYREEEYAKDPLVLDFRESVDSKTYRLGDPIRLDLVLSNTSQRPYKVVNPRLPSGWYPTMAFGVKLVRNRNTVLEIEPSEFYVGSYSGPPGFETLAPGRAFRNSICLQGWLDWQLNLPLTEGDYELSIAFDSSKYAAIRAKGVELLHRWDAKPIQFSIRGPARTDAVEILKLAGQLAGEKHIETDLVSENPARRNWAWDTIRRYGDSRLGDYLEKLVADHEEIYGRDSRHSTDRLRPYSQQRTN